MQSNALHRVLSSVNLFGLWTKNSDPTPKPTNDSLAKEEKVESPSEQFRRLLQPYIDRGLVTFETIEQGLRERYNERDKALQERDVQINNDIEREIQDVAAMLPPSQREQYSALVDRETLLKNKKINHVLSHNASVLMQSFSERLEDYGLVDTVVKITQDPQLLALADANKKATPFEGPIVLYSSMLSMMTQYAAQSPEHLQRTLEHEFTAQKQGTLRILRGSWLSTDSQFIEHLRDEKQYSDADMSVAIRKAWIATDMPLIKLDELDDYVKQLSTGDKELLRQHHVERFVQEHLTGDMQPIPPAKLERLESFVMGTTPVLKAWNLADMQWPKDAAPVKEGDSWANMSNWPFIPVPTPMDRLANVLIQAYTIDEIVPLLEAYQGHRALDGGMKASEFVADVKTYLQERAAAHNPVIQEPSISTTLAPQ